MLAGVGAWALRVERRRAARTDWKRPLRVAVVLLGNTAPVDGWARGLERLEKWLHDEFVRWRGTEGVPVRFRLHGPVAVEVPEFEPTDDRLFTRLTHAWRLSRALAKIDEAAGVARSEIRIYVALTHESGVTSVEGVGEQGGEVGLVRATADEDPQLALAAVAHELFHCLGAEDKYDGAGHARAPEGLVEPERGMAQRYAEVMVGEVSLAVGKGRLPSSLDEVRVGAQTAAEIRWR